MKRLITFITEYNEPNPPEIVGSEFFVFKTDDEKYIKVGATEDPTFGISEFKTLDEFIDWVNDQRLNNVQRQISAGWTPPPDYNPPPKSVIAGLVEPVWETVFESST